MLVQHSPVLKAVVILVWVASLVVVIPDVMFTNYKVLMSLSIFFRIIIKIPPWQGARRWPTREASMLQGAEGGRSCRDHLWRRHPTSAGVNYKSNLVLMLALPLMLSMLHAVPGSSASDGVHKWNDCIHSVEEEGDRRGDWNACLKLRWKKLFEDDNIFV